MADNVLTYDILVGKNDLSPVLNKLGSKPPNMNAIKDGLDGIASSTANINNVLSQGEGLGKLKQFGVNVKDNEMQLKKLGKQAGLTGKQIEDAMNRGKLAAKGFDFTFMKFLFGGMAIQRIFGGVFRSMFGFFNKLENNSLISKKRVNDLTASFEFLKFQIFDSVASSDIFADFVNGISAAAEKVGEIFRNTKLADTVFTVSSIGLVAGSALVGAGILSQIGSIFGDLFVKGGPATFSGTLAAGTASIGFAVSIGVTINDILKLVNNIKSGKTEEIGTDIKNIIADIALTAGFLTLRYNPALGAFIITTALVIRFSDVIFGGIGESLGDLGKFIAEKLGITGEEGALTSAVELSNKLEELGQGNIFTDIIKKVGLVASDLGLIPKQVEDTVNPAIMSWGDAIETGPISKLKIANSIIKDDMVESYKATQTFYDENPLTITIIEKRVSSSFVGPPEEEETVV